MQVNMIGSCYLYSYHRKHSKEQRCSIYKFPIQLNSCFPLFRELLNLFLSRRICHLLQGFLYLFLLKVMLSMSITKTSKRFLLFMLKDLFVSMLSTTSNILQKQKHNLNTIVTPFMVSILMSKYPCTAHAE